MLRTYVRGRPRFGGGGLSLFPGLVARSHCYFRPAPGLGIEMKKAPQKTVSALAAAAILAAGLTPAAATAAASRTVKDAKFDTPAVSKNGRLDITKATTSRKAGDTKFSVSMRAKVKPSRSKERPGIFLNTKGGKRSSPEFIVFGSTIFRVKSNGSAVAIGDASLTSSKRTWRFSFDASQVKALADGYGWAVVTQKGKNIADIAPDKGYVNSK